MKEKILKTALHRALCDSRDVITDEDVSYALDEIRKEVKHSDKMFV